MRTYFKEELKMKKIELGLFALCVLVGSYFGSMFGIAIAVCAFMTIDGLIEEFIKKPRKGKREETEVK
jgi:hypothetical protein